MDKAARALQLAGCVAHTGDAFTFAPGDLEAPVVWLANPSAEAAPGTGKLNPLIRTGRVQLIGARSAFAAPAREPRVGEDLTDAAGNLYSIAEIPPDPLNPLLVVVCTVSLATPA